MFDTVATILHADLDAFYASVEQRDNPALRGKPILVGGGVVLAASYEAKAYGVKTAMTGRQAKELCPHAITVPCRFDAYTEASRAVFDVFEDVSPVVEGLSIDEAFIDVSGLRNLATSPAAVAIDLRQKVLDEVGLPISVGVARTKFLAKVASAAAKPDGLIVVDPDGETDFLYPLPVRALWGVGKITAGKLNDAGLFTVADVAELSSHQLERLLGKGSGRHLYALCHHQDARRVQTGKRRGSVGSQQALGQQARSRAELEAILLGIVDRVTRRLRKGGRVGRTITLRMRHADFTRSTRSHTLRWPTAETKVIADRSLALFDANYDLVRDRGTTLIGMSVSQLSTDKVVQLALPFDRTATGNLDNAIDSLRGRFGNTTVKRASALGQRSAMEIPKLPD